MKTPSSRPFPAIEKQMNALGQRLREARLRRGISTLLFAERMNVSRDTLNRLEKGDPSIAMGTYARALRVLGIEKDIDKVAQDDELGRKLQDLKLPVARKPRGSSVRSRPTGTESTAENHGNQETD
jgi:transcriptional regulator with XRE-family HTH domain